MSQASPAGMHNVVQDTSQPEIELKADETVHASRDNDLTVYWDRDSIPRMAPIGSELHGFFESFKNDTDRGLSLQTKPRFDGLVTLKLKDTAPEDATLPARVNIVRCNLGANLAATFRIQGRKRPEQGVKLVARLESEYSSNKLPNLVHARYLRDRLFGTKERSAYQGAIVVSGETGSGKSDVARALTKVLLHDLIDGNNERFPHLVTIEDPIESWHFATGEKAFDDLKIPANSSKYNFCLTAREIGIDVMSIEQAIHDAYRQTPQCVYIGEVRQPGEWQHILNFAGSGHLVIITTHAASVRETVARLGAAIEAGTPAERRQWFGNMRGIVHLKRDKCRANKAGSTENKIGSPFPSIWCGNATAINGLVSVGLSSVCPNSSYFTGRRRYVDDLLDTRETARLSQKVIKELEMMREPARKFDLEELRRQ